MAERLAADAGTHRWGHNVSLGYFAQDHHDLLTDPRQTPLGFVWDACPAESMTYVRGQLGRMLFSGGDVDKPAAALSGGEAARLVFTRLAVQKPNVLILDEPTNHLDLESIDALTEALLAYAGTLVFVSHDRHFVAGLATRIMELRADGLHDFRGGYDDYVRLDGDDHLDVEAVMQKASNEKRADGDAGRKGRQGRQLGWEQQKKLANRRRSLPKRREQILSEIEAGEKEKAAITQQYADPGFYLRTPFDEIERLQARHQELTRKIEENMATWEAIEKELALDEQESA